MDTTLITQVVLLALLLALSGFFSSSETALFSLKRNHRQEISDKYPERASVIEKLLSQPRRLIIALLIGNESVNVAASAISTAIILSIYGDDSAYLNLFFMVPLLLLFGEITPKTLAIRNNIKFAIFQAPLIDKFTWLTTPIRGVVRSIADRIITLIIGKERSEGNLITEDMMRTLAADALQRGALDSTEAEMIHQIFDFGNVTAEDIMTPRSDISSIPLKMSMPQCLENFASHRHTKIPVFGKNRDDITGILFARELMGVNLTDDKRHLYDYKHLLRAPYFVPETKSGADLFKVFRDKKISIAVVVDEYGGVVGLVTMEDLLETIFGDIYSPSEEDARSSFSIEDGRYIVDGIMEIDDFNSEFNTHLSEEHVDTVGGLIFHTLGELPDEGDSVRFDGLELVVISMRDNRISDIEIKFDKPPTLKDPTPKEAGQ
ncbi:MAG: putative hemolysin [Saprospiraceae bacterium]|jgi:putative hemolysin